MKQDYQNLLYKGHIAWEKKELKSALSYLLEAEKLFFSSDHLIDIALIYDELGDNDLAEMYYRKILQFDEFNATAYYGIATLYDNQKKYEEAISYYKEAIRLDPNYYTAHFFLANICDDISKRDLAIIHYRKTIEICPTYFWAYMNLGQIYESENQNEKALGLFLKAEAIDQTNHLIYFNLGVVYKKLGKIEKSIENYKKSLEITKQYPFTFLNLALIYKDIYNDLRTALSIYSEGINLHPKHAILLYNRGCIYALIGEEEHAIRDLVLAGDLNPKIKAFMYEDPELKELRDSTLFKKSFTD